MAVSYPYGITDAIPELLTLREQWAKIDEVYQLQKEDYSKRGEQIKKDLRITQNDLKKGVRYNYAIETIQMRVDTYNNAATETAPWLIITRKVDEDTIVGITNFEGDKYPHTRPFQIANNVLYFNTEYYKGTAFSINLEQGLVTEEFAAMILAGEIPEGIIKPGV